MDNRIKETLDAIQTPERLKRITKANLRRRTFDYGRNVLQLRRYRSRVAGCIASLALVAGSAGLWFMPSASISMDINPSIEIRVNALDRVISVEGRNADGTELVKQLDVDGMPYDDAMQRILLSDALSVFVENGSNITITVAGGGSDIHAEEILSKVLCRAYNIAEKENILYCQVNWETVKAAKAAGLTIPRYLVWQRLLEANPNITPEEIWQIPEKTIRILAQTKIIDNPCHE